jgi:hypothetical protein
MRKLIIALAAAAFLSGGVYAGGSAAAAQEVTLYKNPQCGCCSEYAEYLRKNGFRVAVKSTDNLDAMNREIGIPENLQSCHLAFVDGYFVGGHVPVGIINRVLQERPAIKGVSLPGMPMGSPGMGGAKTEPFVVYGIGAGKPSVYSAE